MADGRRSDSVLIEAFRRVRKELPDAKLTVVSARAPLLNEPGVEQLGMISDEQLHHLFSTCSLFSMPSICESWGLVYVEAAAHGCLTANWSNCALPDIVDQSVTGVLSDRHDAEGLAEAILDALRDPRHLMERGQNAVRRVRDVLDWPHVVDRLCWRPRCLKRLMGARRCGCVRADWAGPSPPRHGRNWCV